MSNPNPKDTNQTPGGLNLPDDDPGIARVQYEAAVLDDIAEVQRDVSPTDAIFENESDSDTEGDLEAIPCGGLESLEAQTWERFDDAERSLFQLVKTKNFGVARKRKTYQHPQSKDYHRYDYECCQGETKAPRGTGKKKMRTFRSGCAYRCSLRYSRKAGVWKFFIDNDEHNHNGVRDAGRLPRLRKFDRKTHEKETQHAIERYRSNPNLTAYQATGDFKDSVDEPVHFYEQGLRNLVYANKRDENGPYSETQKFLQELENDPDIYYRAKFKDGETGELQFVFWTTKWSIDQWRLNPEVLLLDNTYKTNRFNLPLMQIAGVTGSHTSFNIGWAVMMNEAQAGYYWVFAQAREVMRQYTIAEPYVIITDKDDAARNSIRRLFDNGLTATQICLWHVMKNVSFHIKIKWKGTLEGTILGQTIGGEGSRTSQEREEKQVNRFADSLLNREDRQTRAANENNRTIPPEHREGRRGEEGEEDEGRKYDNSADGILAAWRDCVYAESKETFDDNWN